MNQELPKAYDAKVVDAKWYQFWEAKGFFRANPASEKPPYCIVIPPPNVTGTLHMGHALVDTLQDILIRWKRMCGFEALWVPGTDHAGISTQTVVERHLIETTGKRRKDFAREEFLEHMWQWKEKNQHHIIGQLKRLGCSCDWTRERFTLDEANNQAVRSAFKKLFDDGLIYRGKRLVNWDTATQTTLSDEEVEYEEKQGWLWYFKYPLKGQDQTFARIATTRPETMLGDTAVAVSPKDPRYSDLIGKTIILPLVGREIPIIADHLVNPEFGTGMVKVTPAHDPNDYQMGLSHALPMINIMTPDGKINDQGGQFKGLSMLEARAAIVKEMEALGLLEKVEPHTNRVGTSYRSKAVIEPYLSEQWFIKMDSFAKKLRALVENKKFNIVPKQWESTYFHWIDNLRDWCISRQLWWGHRIPIWYSKEDPSIFICDDSPNGPAQVAKEPDKWQQEEDVLDTWFSSALWPFAVLGWPNNTPELARFYPTSILVTGHDILFFWVTRMLMMGEYLMGDAPFPEAFLHGLIYAKSYWRQAPGGGIAYVPIAERRQYEAGKSVPKDVYSKWEKMSKTKGNIIDPIEIIDDYGTDALRMALAASPSQAREIDLDMRRFEEFKNFANKIWNGARFVFMNLEGHPDKGSTALTAHDFASGLDTDILALEDRWILSLLNKTIAHVNQHLTDYLFEQATLEAYDFFWKHFCAYYLEIAKPVLAGAEGRHRKNKQKLLVIVLLHVVRLLHPIAPFITEELFQHIKASLAASAGRSADPYTIEALKALASEACMVAPYPQVVSQEDLNPEIDQAFALVEELVYAIRNIRGEMKMPPGVAIDVHFVLNDQTVETREWSTYIAILRALVKIDQAHVHHAEPANKGAVAIAMVGRVKVMVPIPQELLQKEKGRLQKEKERLEVSLAKIRMQLDNADFVKNAPPQLVQKHVQQQQDTQNELAAIELKLSEL